jgi:hypothetical protein
MSSMRPNSPDREIPMSVTVEETPTATVVKFKNVSAPVQRLEIVPGSSVQEGEIDVGGVKAYGVTISVRPA